MRVKEVEKKSGSMTILVETDSWVKPGVSHITQENTEDISRTLNLAVKALGIADRLWRADIRIIPREQDGLFAYQAQLMVMPNVTISDWDQIRVDRGQFPDAMSFEQKLFDELLSRAKFTESATPEHMASELDKMRAELAATLAQAGHPQAAVDEAIRQRFVRDQAEFNNQALRRIKISAILKKISAALGNELERETDGAISNSGTALFQARQGSIDDNRRIINTLAERVAR